MLITSLDNKKIKKYFKLKQKKYRDLEQLFLIESEHLIVEALKDKKLVDLLVLEDTKVEIEFDFTYVTENVMKKLTNLETVPEMIGVARMNEPREELGDKVLLLDDISDPGNLGTIIRSSLAFGVLDIVLGNNSVDLYNDKVIRSSEGMLFKVNVLRGNLKDYVSSLKKNGYLILGTNVKDGVDVREIKASKFALIMGNEGRGVSEELSLMCDKNLYIKMNPNCESLNVGVATSILLYELNR